MSLLWEATLPDGKVLKLFDAPAPSAPSEQVYLLVSSGMIETTNTVRVVKQPVRRPTPVVSAADGNRNFQAAVLRDPTTGGWKMWHGVWDGRDALGNSIVRNVIRTSQDGISWGAPMLIPSLGVGAIANVVDSGIAGPSRYRLITRSSAPAQQYNRWNGWQWFSPDGLTWTPSAANPVTEPCGEIYVMHPEGVLMRYNRAPWTDAAGVHVNSLHDPSFYRTFYQARLGTDGVRYGAATSVYLPQSGEGETQFYSVSNVIRRGDTRLLALNILRDDWTATDVPAGAYGMGYTVLGWSMDGSVWDRHWGTDPHYLDPNPLAGSWDHAVTWVTSLVEVGDKVHVYYGAYGMGHKSYTDRSIAVAIIDCDRYVARAAPDTIARHLRTRPFILRGGKLTVNARGGVRARLLDAATNAVIPGYGYDDALPLPVAGGLAMPWTPAAGLTPLTGRAVKAEFELTAGELYAFYVG